jgi:hypothetical protein
MSLHSSLDIGGLSIQVTSQTKVTNSENDNFLKSIVRVCIYHILIII